jgi:hypothetical protein
MNNGTARDVRGPPAIANENNPCWRRTGWSRRLAPGFEFEFHVKPPPS